MMKRISFFLLAFIISLTAWPIYNPSIEKSLKKQYKEVKYLAHSDCYLVMSKQDKGYYGVINSNGEKLVEPVYKKISFEKDNKNGFFIFALDPHYKANSQGNLVLNNNGKIVLNMGKNEPQFILGGFISSYLKPIYDLDGKLVLNCQQTSVQPIRKGREIVAYRVGNRTINNDKIEDSVIICDNNFKELFVLEGQNYLWTIEEVMLSENNKGWKCQRKGDDKELFYTLNGERINNIIPDELDTNPSLASNVFIKGNENKVEITPPSKEIIEESKKQDKKNNISYVDYNIPKTNHINNQTFALIIGNENYHDVENVPNAKHDAEIFKEYCINLFGIPKSNVHLIKDATLNNIRRELKLISQIVEEFNGEANILFYYAGHGIPDEKTKNPFIVPVDGYSSDISTCYSTEELYSKLGRLPANKIIIFMDACFSGSLRGEGMLSSARGISIKSNSQDPKGKMVIFSAAQGDETAYSYKEEGHGMFTYYLLKHLKESNGEISLKDLSEKIESDVRKQSLIMNGKRQTPIVQYSSQIQDLWSEWKLNE